MGEWKGGPRTQIIKQIMSMFTKSPKTGQESLVHPRAGASGIQNKLFEGVEGIDQAGRYLSGVNKTKKYINHQLQNIKGFLELIRIKNKRGYDLYGNPQTSKTRAEMLEQNKKLKEAQRGYIQRLESDEQQKILAKTDAKDIVDAMGGSGEVRRQRELFKKVLEKVQQKRPFEN
jgi:hypothetical protein